MMKTLKKVWSRSWIVTVPVVLVFAMWARGTYARWNDFTVRHFTSQDLSLLKVGQLEAGHMARSAELEATKWGTYEKLQSTGLDTVHLFIKDGSLQRLNSDLPHSGFEYVDGGMFYGDEVHGVDLRYRGDNVYHWGFWKKSWRVKTKRGALYKGMRKFNLIAPRTTEVLNNYLSYRLGSHMGLISPYAELVNVAVNGKYQGVFILTEQLEESTIRRHDRMPGDVYSGELVGMDALQGVDNRIFDHPGVWTKAAVNNHFDDGALDPLEHLLKAIENADSPEGQRRLSELVNIEAFAKFSAFEALACTVHIDAQHNWRLYYDPWETAFEPIVWDPVGWHRTVMPRPQTPLRPDVITSPFHAALFRNAEFLRARSRAFDEFFAMGKDQAFLAEARDLIGRVRPALELDGHLVTDVQMVAPESVQGAMVVLVNRIESLFEDLYQTHVVDPSGLVRFRPRSPGRIEIEVNGRRPIEELELQYSGPVTGPLVTTLDWKNISGPKRTYVTGSTSIRGSRIFLGVDLISRHQPSITTMDPSDAWRNGLKMQPARYVLEFAPRPGSFSETDEATALARALGGELVGVRFRRAGSDAWETAHAASDITANDHGRTELVVTDDIGVPPVVISGDIVLEGDRIIDADVIFKPGTTIRMKTGANLLLRGRVLAQGSADRPIRFIPHTEGQEPWGIVGIKGRGADGSRFNHCIFREGSGWKQPLAEYSAMFSIHGVQDVTVANCDFEDSRTLIHPVYGEYLVDDMVHGVYSKVRFLRCNFRRSFADALDMDISEVSLEGCLFEDSGNDSVDLMTAKATVLDTRFTNSFDKGISVGEHSYLVLQNSLMHRCNIGVQCKDESTATVVNSDFIECNQALDAYSKNWRYEGGGVAYVHKSRFIGNGQSLSADRKSRIVVRDSYMDQIPAVDPRRIQIDGSVDEKSAEKAVKRGLERLPEEIRQLRGVGRSLLESANPSRRGSTLHSVQ